MTSTTDGGVYIVISPNGDVELLDAMPRWDWARLGQTVRLGNINGGDSIPVAMPETNREPDLPLTRGTVPAGIDAAGTLEAIVEVLDGTEWNAETCTRIAEILRGAGYWIRDADERGEP